MESEAIFIYCLADTVVKSSDIHDDPQSHMTHAEIITFVMISALYYRCNYAITRKVIAHCRYFSRPISHSRLIRRVHLLPQYVWEVMFVICKSALKVNRSKHFIIDSFPVAVCQNNKIFRCKLVKAKHYRGYTASKKSYFFCIKVHMTVTPEGIPVEFLITPGSTADVKALKGFQLDLPKNSKLYGDGAYNDYVFEELLHKTSMIKLVPKRRKNSRRKNSSDEEFFL